MKAIYLLGPALAFSSAIAFANETKTTGRYGAPAENLIAALESAGIVAYEYGDSLDYFTNQMVCGFQAENPTEASCESAEFSVSGDQAIAIRNALSPFGVTADSAMGGRYSYEVPAIVCKVHKTGPAAQRAGCSVTYVNVQ